MLTVAIDYVKYTLIVTHSYKIEKGKITMHHAAIFWHDQTLSENN